MKEMKIIYKKVEDIIPYENNPRNNDNAVQYVANSIKEFGFKNPIIIDKDNIIVAGHTRLKAAEKLGLVEVPCIMADDLSEEQIKAFRIADNKVAEYSTWNLEKLNLELEDINIDMSDFGILDLKIEEDTADDKTDLSNDIEDKYQIIIECVDEIEQEDLFNKLNSEGIKCRILTL